MAASEASRVHQSFMREQSITSYDRVFECIHQIELPVV
jgi:hypothetical protein